MMMILGIQSGRNGRVLAWMATALLLALVAVVGPVSMRADATTTGVSNETQLRSALTALSSDTSGDHTINITANFSVSDTAGDPTYSGSKNLTINGNGHTVTGTGGDIVRLIAFNSSALLAIKNLTANNFTGFETGGVISTTHGDVLLEDSAFSGNTATAGTLSNGGVLYDSDGDVTIMGSSFTGNHAMPTGGQALAGAIFAGGDAVLLNATFVGNYADGGPGSAAAGALLAVGYLVVVDSTFDSNFVTADAFVEGGAIIGDGFTYITTSTFTGNSLISATSEALGGAIYFSNGGFIENSTLVGNTASAPASGPATDARGGALYVTGGMTLRHVTMSANSAADGGAHVDSVSSFLDPHSGYLTVDDSILVDAVGSSSCSFRDSAGTSGGYNFVSDTSCFAAATTDTVGADPQLGALADNGGPTKTMAPTSASSPVVDAIPAASCTVDADQRGAYRPSQGACDIGAVELLQDDAGLVVRLAGAGRYETAAAISKYHHPFGAASVYVSTGTNFPDALAGAAAAAREGSPLLLTGPTVPDPTSLELYRLDRTGSLTDAILLGGTSVVTPDVDAFMAASGLATTRLAGSDRYSTAVAISKHSFPSTAPVVVIATGTGFADALAGGPAAKKFGGPVLLTAPDALPQVVADEIARLSPSTILVLGGTGAVSDAVKTQLQALAPTVTRISGASRYETAVAISQYAFPNPGDVHSVYIAVGTNFPDALAGAAEAAAKGVPILLTPTDTLPTNVANEIDRLHVSTIYILGGTGVVSTAVETQLGTHVESPN